MGGKVEKELACSLGGSWLGVGQETFGALLHLGAQFCLHAGGLPEVSGCACSLCSLPGRELLEGEDWVLPILMSPLGPVHIYQLNE